MIVVIAAGSTPNVSLDPTHSIQTLTAYIVQVSLGDAPHGTITYYSMYLCRCNIIFVYLYYEHHFAVNYAPF